MKAAERQGSAVTGEDRKLFLAACKRGNAEDKRRGGIGTMREKTVHAVLKYYMEPRERYHEIPCGKFIADILAEGEITEIQTAHFHLLRRKLEEYLPQYEVTVVYPIPHKKWVYWVDPETGETKGPRKSPKTGSVYDCFRELYRIKPFLKDEHLHFRILLVDMEEYRYLNGWSRDKKKGSTRADRYPLDLWEDWMIASGEDYKNMLPGGLKTEFTSLDFAKAAGIRRQTAQTALNILTYMGAVKQLGRDKRGILYGKP